jgi:hypothetical protein
MMNEEPGALPGSLFMYCVNSSFSISGIIWAAANNSKILACALLEQ